MLISVYGYAKISSIRIAKEVQNEIAINPLPTYRSEEGKSELINLGYTITDETKGNEYSEDSHYFTAVKEDASVEVIAEVPHWIGYYYSNTDESITPMIYNIQFGDSYETVKDKLGINSLNTLFQNIMFMNPGLYTDNNDYSCYIETSAKDWRYYLIFDENDHLIKIQIQNFTAYD